MSSQNLNTIEFYLPVSKCNCPFCGQSLNKKITKVICSHNHYSHCCCYSRLKEHLIDPFCPFCLLSNEQKPIENSIQVKHWAIISFLRLDYQYQIENFCSNDIEEECSRNYQLFLKLYNDSGDPFYTYFLGIISDYQLNVSNIESLKWFKISDEKLHHGVSQLILGLSHYNLKQYDKAFMFLEKSSNQLFPQAIYNYGMFFYNGLGTKPDKNKAFKLIKKAVDLININEVSFIKTELMKKDNWIILALNQLSYFYNKGEGTPKNISKAKSLLLKAASRGSIDSYRDLGMIYYDLKDYKEATRWLKKAFKEGMDSKSIMILSLIYLHGREGVAKNIALSKKLLKFTDNPMGLSIMGDIYLNSKNNIPESVLSNLERTKKIIQRRNKNNGIATSESILEEIDSIKENMVNENVKLAIKYYSIAAERGEREAQFNLAFFHHQNCYPNYLKFDLELAKFWYLKSAIQGCLRAQYCLGKLLSQRGPHYDKEGAYKWLLKASASGFKEARKDILNLKNLNE